MAAIRVQFVSALMTALLAVVTCYLYRPLFRQHPARSAAPTRPWWARALRARRLVAEH